MIKKIVLALILILVIAGGVFFFMNSNDNYDASKYSATVPAMQEGSAINFTLPDQFDKAHTLSVDTKTLVFTFAKASSHIVRDFLQTQATDYLSARNAYYVADISPMPTVIRNAFAMPDLKKSAYPVILIYDATIAAKFRDDAQKAAIMIVSLDNKTITKIQYVNDTQALKAILK